MRRFALALVAIVLLGFASFASADPANGPLRASLSQRLPELKFDNVPFRDALDYVRDVSGCNMHVDWKTLAAAGVDANANVNMRVHTITLRKALNLLLQEASPTVPLTFFLDSGVMEVTTREAADKQLITLVYPIDDLIMEVPDFEGPSMNLASANSGSSGSSSSSSSSSPFASSSSTSTEKVTTKADRAEQLVSLIRDTVQPDCWKENGGIASIHYFNGSLIISAPRSVHEAIGGPLD